MDKTLNYGICKDECPVGKYEEPSFGFRKCLECDKTCRTCTGPTEMNCTFCKEGTYLFENTCKSTCPRHVLAINETWKCEKRCDYRCRDCVSPFPNECTICQESRYLKIEKDNYGTCDCPTSFYQVGDSTNKNYTCLRKKMYNLKIA